MRQTRMMSAVESVTNVVVGLLVSLAVQVAVFPWFGLRLDASRHVALTAIFTAVSVARSYVVRRMFERMRR